MQVYNQTDQWLHWLSQPIAKAGRSFANVQEDDQHMNIYFDAVGRRIVGRWVTSSQGQIMLTLKLDTLSFEWVNDTFQVINKVGSVGKTLAEVENELAVQLKEVGLNAEGFTQAMNFEMPNYPFLQNKIPRLDNEHMQEWMTCRKLANDACALVLGHLQASGEIRIWPHHFDTGIFVSPNDRLGIGFGLAMHDQQSDTPYFYVAGYPKNHSLNYENVAELSQGRWVVEEGWKGAILPLSTLVGEKQETWGELINTFLETTLQWFIKQ